MAGATRTTADAILQEDYQPAVREQLNNDIPLLTYMEKKGLDTDGRRAVLSLHTGRNQGVGARAEGGTLPTAGNQAFAEQRVPVYSNYGRGKITGQLMRSADKGSASFTNALTAELDGIVTDLKRDVNRQVWGTSDGAIAAVTLTTNSVVINLASTVSNVQFDQIQAGMPVDIGTVAAPTGTTSNNAVVSTGGSAGAYTVTLTTAATTTGATYIFRTGNGGSGTDQKEVTGMQSIVLDSGTLHNVSPTTYPVWKATVNSNSGTNRAITESLMISTVHSINRASGTWPNMGVAEYGVQRAFGAHLTSMKRAVNTVDLTGGYSKGISFVAGGGSEIAITIDRDCPANSMFFFNTKNMFQYERSDWEFADEDGAVLSRVSGEDAYDFFLYKDHEIATDRRNAHGWLKDLTAA